MAKALTTNPATFLVLGGLLFFGLAAFDIVMGKRDPMTYTFFFLGTLACLVSSAFQRLEIRFQSIETRLDSIEQSLKSPQNTHPDQQNH